MPDIEPKSSLDILDNSSTLVPITSGDPVRSANPDPITNFVLNQTTPKYNINTQKLFVEDVQGELNPRFDTVKYGYNNEDAAAQSQSFLDKAFNGVAKGVGLAATTFASGISDVVYGIPSALMSGDITKIWDNEITKGLQAFNKKVDDEYLPNYYSDQEKNASWYGTDNLFTANFLFDKLVKNAGFAVGAIYSGNLVGKGLSVGGKALGTMFNSVADYSQAYKSFSGINNNLARLFSQGRNVEAAEALKSGISSLPELENTTSALTKIASQQNNIANVSDFTNRTIRALYSSAGESNFEALGTATAYRENLIKEYKDKWGVEPPKEDIDRIDEMSKQVGKSSFLANMAVLSLTEYLQMPHLLGSSYKTSKAAANAFRETNEVVTDATGKLITKPTNLLRKSSRFAGTYLFDPKESAQEYFQTAIDKGTQNYYNKAYKGEEVDAWTEAFDSVTGIWGTKEGMESALLGGITGGLMQVKGKFIQSNNRAANTSEFISKAQGSTFDQVFQEKKEAAQRHINLENEAAQHAADGNRLSWMDNKFDQAHNYIAPRIKFGRTDLIQRDLEERKALAMSEEGYKQLQATGEAPTSLKREDYVQKLNEFEQQVKDTIQLHEASYLSYGGQVNTNGTRKYSDAVIDKLIYAAAKITDYDKRIPALSQELTRKGIQLQNILQEVTGEKFDNSPYEEARKELDLNQNITDEQRKDLIQQLLDVRELTKRRKEYIEEYNSIRATPENFKEIVPIQIETSLNSDEIPTVKIKTKDGEEDLEVGTEYFLGKVTETSKEGKDVYRFPKLTILGENEDGTIQIKDSTGQVRNISKDVLADYKLGKVPDTLSNKKAKFFMENANTIFQFNFGKGKKVNGRLEYSSKEGVLKFVYKDKNKVKSIEVTGDQFVAKKGYTNPLISVVGTLTAAQQSALDSFKQEKDSRASVKRGNRLEIIGKLIDENNSKLEELNRKIFDKKERLEKAAKDIAELSEFNSKDKYGKVIPVPFAKVLQRSMQGLTSLSSLKVSLEKEVEELQAYKDELEFNGEYFNDLAQNLDQLPTDSKEFLQELKDQYDAIIDASLMVGNEISIFTKMIDSIKSIIKDLSSFLQSAFTKFDRDYPSEIRNSLQDDEELFKSPQDLKNYIADYTLLKDVQKDINLNEEKIDPITNKIEDLYKELAKLEKEASAKWAVFNKFNEAVQEFKDNEAEKVKLAQNKEIQEKYFIQQKAQEQTSGIATEDKIPAREPAKKDLANGPISGTDPAWEDTTADDNFHRRHQTFEFNMTSNDPAKFNQENKAKMRIIPISSVTAKELGFSEDWIDPQYRFDGSNVDTAAIRYVYVIQEGKQLFYTDEKGNKLEEVGKESVDSTKIIYTNAENTTFKDGQKGEFTNKNNLDKEVVRKAWRELRTELFKIKASEIKDYAYNFKTSRGFLNQTKDVVRNTNLFDAGIITAQDLNNVVIDIPGNDKKFPKGVPMFNYAGNTFFLNNRKLTDQEATQVYDVLVYAATHSEGFSNRIFDYLKNVIYFSTSRDENKQLKRNQIFLKKDEEFPALVIGENEVEIQFIPFSTSDGNNLIDKKAEIIGFLKEAYHHVNSNTLSKQKEGITKFNELSVEGEEIKIKEWPSYQHYLLEQRKGEQSPLTANVAIPQKGEIPIKEKYPIVEYKSFDIGTPTPTPTNQETISERVDIFDTTSNVFRNVDKTISRVEVTSIKATQEFKVGETTFKAGDEIKHIVPVDAIKVIEENLKLKHSPKVKVKEKENLTVDFQGFKITMSVDRDANKVATKVTVESMIATPAAQGTVEGQDYKDAYKEIIPKIEQGFLDQLNAKKETEVVQKQDEAAPDVLNQSSQVKPDVVDTKSNIDNLLDDSDGEFEDAREATDNYKTYHGDKDVETEDVSFMLPQVKQSMVSNLISMIGGGKAWGMARSRMMEIYEGAPFGTKYHESFEQIFNWILTPSEQNDLWEEFKTKQGTFTSYKGETKPYSEATFKEAKEEMAENFIEYKQTATKPKPSNKIIQFFKDLWNFLKEMLNAHPATIANVFDKLNNGVYRIANIRATKGEEYRERSVQGESVSFVNTMLSGMTADMFISKWQDDVGIIMDLEENPGEAEGKLFSELKNRMTDYFENPKNKSGVITYYKWMINKETDPTKIVELKESLQEVLKAWSRVKSQWTNYTEELKGFLRTFDISFQVDDEGNLAIDSNIDENEINNRDYMDDRMTINAKNSASKVVKLLMATISDSQFKGVVEKSIKAVIDNSTIPVRDNAMRMKMLVPYAKLFNYILHNTTGLQGIYSIVGKLQEISENTNIKQNANVKGVLDRIKFNSENYFKGFSLPQIKMILKLESALSKYKPLFMSQELTEEGKTINKPSSKFGRIEQLTTEWANNLKSSPYATVTGENIQLSEKLFSFDPFIFVKNLIHYNKYGSTAIPGLQQVGITPFCK